MSFDSHMEAFEKQQDKDYPNHIKVGDNVGRYVQYVGSHGLWTLKELGRVNYVGPGYARVDFVSRGLPVNIPLNKDVGNINELVRIDGCKFRGPLRSNGDNDR